MSVAQRPIGLRGERGAPAAAQAVAAGGGPPGPPRVRARGAPGRLLPLRSLPRLPRPLPRDPLRRVRGRLRRFPFPFRRVQEVVGAVVPVPGGVARARRGRAATGVRLLARRGAAALGPWRRARARAGRAGAPLEGRRVRPVQGAAVRGDEGQVRQRGGRGRVGTAPVVSAEHRHTLPPRRRRRRLALRQVHRLHLGWMEVI